MVDQTINSQQKDPKGCTLSPQLVFKVAYRLERKRKLLEGPGNLIKTFRPFGLRQLKFFFKNRVQVKNLRVKWPKYYSSGDYIVSERLTMAIVIEYNKVVSCMVQYKPRLKLDH